MNALSHQLLKKHIDHVSMIEKLLTTPAASGLLTWLLLLGLTTAARSFCLCGLRC